MSGLGSSPHYTRRVQQEPACARICGLIAEDPRLKDFEDRIARMPEELHQSWDEGTPPPATISASGQWIVYADGACERSQHPTLRRAGYGIWWGTHRCLNASAALAGPYQTNQRAELMAVVKVLEQCGACPVDIRTDPLYVQRGASAWAVWRSRGWRGSHEDLWHRFSLAMREKTEGQVVFTKVKGHASWGDVRQGRVTRQDKVGNAMADFLAVQGAALHPAAIHLASAQDERTQFAKDLQKMYLRILMEQGKDTRDIEDAMPNFGNGSFVRSTRHHRRGRHRSIQVALGSPPPGSKRRRLASPRASLDLHVDPSMQT